MVKVDSKTAKIVIKVGKNNETLKAEPQMLAGLTTGERITFEKSGKTLKSIKPVQEQKMEAPAPAKAETAAQPKARQVRPTWIDRKTTPRRGGLAAAPPAAMPMARTGLRCAGAKWPWA